MERSGVRKRRSKGKRWREMWHEKEQSRFKRKAVRGSSKYSGGGGREMARKDGRWTNNIKERGQAIRKEEVKVKKTKEGEQRKVLGRGTRGKNRTNE